MTSSLGKMAVSCNADTSALKSRANGIANGEYYCALIFPWPFVFMAPVRNLCRGVAVLWEKTLAFHGLLVKVPL